MLPTPLQTPKNKIKDNIHGFFVLLIPFFMSRGKDQ